ncbi:MAG TPA: CBS domain-containing protein [Anaerolineales bacterium]|nr:CBS domain-containing protein [Anaerolineales bacterium]HRF45991.1 CBS domain-containing protein [Anaerolineales bacterium]
MTPLSEALNALPGGSETHRANLKTLLAQRAQARVIAADPGESMQHVIRRLRAHHISQMPVISAGGKLLGLVTETDLLDRVRNPSHVVDLDVPVSTVMREHPPTVTVSTPLEQALRLGAQGDPIVVLEGERVIGLITAIDLLDYLATGASLPVE